MTNTQAERLAKLETIASQQAGEIQKLTKISEEMVKFVAVQTALNQRAKVTHEEERQERWQIWVRWLFNPGLPVVAILALLWRMLTEGVP